MKQIKKQIKKLSLSNVVGKLTRNEMRYVMAGSGEFGRDKTYCAFDEQCVTNAPYGYAYCVNGICVH